VTGYGETYFMDPELKYNGPRGGSGGLFMEPNVASVARVIEGLHVTDGAGVHLNRIIGSHQLGDIDPFVLLDEFRSDDPDDYIAGFPWHPHRGIETITYMVEGAFRHDDSKGGGGVLSTGECQWMTAGGGILHQEMPEMKEGHLWGYQLWLNLAAKDKFLSPRYQHLTDECMPTVEHNGVTVKIIAGAYAGDSGPAETSYPIDYFDARMGPDGRFEHTVTEEQDKFLYVHSGVVVIDPDGEAVEVRKGHLAILGEGTDVVINGKESGSGFLFLAGVPHREPIVKGGPFVMNTQEEIRQAWQDFYDGKIHQ
jgi:redox-sensitive bicupin YhaK (pirin superfamily)